jgi:hypothetical protein
MFDRFRIIPFLLGLLVGFVVLMIYKPEKKEIKQYPHPSETSDKIFKDPNGTCYKYTTHEVNCDANEGTMKDYPIQGA